VSSKGAKLLDDVAEASLRWAQEVMSWEVARGDPNFLKIHGLKAQAASIAAQLKARIDPGGLKGDKDDRVERVLAERLAEAKAPKPN
jgi:hypothetical protein